MKRAVILTSIVGAGLMAAMLGAQPRGGGLPPIEKIQPVKGNLYKIFGAGGNTTVFVGSKGVVLVDTKLANNGQQILDQVRTVTDKPVTMVINTHVHPDHNGSNQFFKDKWANVDVVLQDNSAALVAKNKQSTDGQKPTKTFKDRLSLGTG
jgi:cyclase